MFTSHVSGLTVVPPSPQMDQIGNLEVLVAEPKGLKVKAPFESSHLTRIAWPWHGHVRVEPCPCKHVEMCQRILVGEGQDSAATNVAQHRNFVVRLYTKTPLFYVCNKPLSWLGDVSQLIPGFAVPDPWVSRMCFARFGRPKGATFSPANVSLCAANEFRNSSPRRAQEDLHQLPSAAHCALEIPLAAGSIGSSLRPTGSYL